MKLFLCIQVRCAFFSSMFMLLPSKNVQIESTNTENVSFLFHTLTGSDILLLIGDISQWTFFQLRRFQNTQFKQEIEKANEQTQSPRMACSGDEFQLINIDTIFRVPYEKVSDTNSHRKRLWFFGTTRRTSLLLHQRPAFSGTFPCNFRSCASTIYVWKKVECLLDLTRNSASTSTLGSANKGSQPNKGPNPGNRCLCTQLFLFFKPTEETKFVHCTCIFIHCPFVVFPHLHRWRERSKKMFYFRFMQTIAVVKIGNSKCATLQNPRNWSRTKTAFWWVRII